MNALIIRPMKNADLAEADRINRIAFGTFFELDDPKEFRGDGDAVHGRFEANPMGSFVAELDGCLVACGFIMDWCGVGILGPLTVDVDYWGQGIARKMMDRMVEFMDQQNFTMQGLFTHPQSSKHIRLYEEYGFRMQRITAVMDKSICAPIASKKEGLVCFSGLNKTEQSNALIECRSLTSEIYRTLDVTSEISAIQRNNFGDTILLYSAHGLEGFACCHQGAMSEAGSQQTLIKFAAVRPGNSIKECFVKLLIAVEQFAIARDITRIVAGTNTGRSECYETMRAHGYRTWMNGIAMLRPEGPGYNLAEVFIVDDWR